MSVEGLKFWNWRMEGKISACCIDHCFEQNQDKIYEKVYKNFNLSYIHDSKSTEMKEL